MMSLVILSVAEGPEPLAVAEASVGGLAEGPEGVGQAGWGQGKGCTAGQTGS